MADEIRHVPFSEEAERGALGSILLESDRLLPIAIHQVRMSATAFHLPAHRIIFEALMDFQDDDKWRPVDVLTLSEHLKSKNQLDEIGGMGYLSRLIDDTPTAAHGEHYLDIVRQRWVQRRIIDICRKTENEAHDVENGEKLLRDIPQRFIDIAEPDKEDETNTQVLEKSVERWTRATAGDLDLGLRVPLDDLNKVMCGLETGITILAGRPSAGKTTLEGQISESLAAAGYHVGRVTLDGTRQEILERDVCRKAGVSLPHLKGGNVHGVKMDVVKNAARSLGEYPMYITDQERDIRMICSWARMQHMRHRLDLLTIDYIQIVQASDMGRNQWEANARTTYISGMLKALAFELEIPILVLSQFSREVDKSDRAPKLSDLRDSGSLEQDAHKVLLVFQDMTINEQMEQMMKNATKKLRPTRIVLAKNKNGLPAATSWWMLPHYFRFENKLAVGPTGEDFGDWETKVEGLRVANRKEASQFREPTLKKDPTWEVDESWAQVSIE